MSKHDQSSDIPYDPGHSPGAPEYISDTKYISKIINQFILNDDETSTEANNTQIRNSQQYNREHVIKALTNLQLTFKPKYIPGQAVNINTDEFKSALMNSMAKLDSVAIPKSMNQIDSRTIDFVEMIFSAFLRDKNISDAIKNLLLLMQIPIIKAALLDSKLFDNDNHPARFMLNSIAHLGIGIEDKENKLYKTIQYIIDQLLQGFDDTLDVFMTAKLSLDRLHDIQRKEHEQTEKQTHHLLTREYARHLVLKDLQYYTMNTSIPKVIQPLILSYWSTLMYQRFINYGTESIEWREAIGILRLLIKTLRPIKTRDDWLALRSIYKGIVNSVNSCLDNSKQNKERIFIATSNLNNYYMSKLTGSEFFSPSRMPPEEDDESYNVHDYFNDSHILAMELSPLDKEVKDSKQIIENMPNFIKPNAWFEVFTDYKHPIRRLKLSSIIKEQAKLIFVDFMGNKVIEKSLKKFITELANDQSRPINDHSIFEYALSMVIISIAAGEN